MKRVPLSEAIATLFNGIKVSHYKELRNVLNKLIDSQIILRAPNKHAYDKHKYFTESSFPAIHNATLLQALFPQTNSVKEIFTKNETRALYAESAKKILELPFFNDVGLTNEVAPFLKMLDSEKSLLEHMLPNPFSILPQVVFGGKHSTLVEIGLKCHALSPQYKMLTAFLSKEIETAYKIAKENSFKTKEELTLQHLIISKYEGAVRAQQFLQKFI